MRSSAPAASFEYRLPWGVILRVLALAGALVFAAVAFVFVCVALTLALTP